eukprot:g2058.t1
MAVLTSTPVSADPVGVVALFKGSKDVLSRLANRHDCSIRREGRVLGRQGNLDLPDLDRFAVLTCAASALKSPLDAGFLSGENQPFLLLEGDLREFEVPAATQANQREYLIKLSYYTNSDLSGRAEDLKALAEAVAPLDDPYKTESFLEVHRASGLRTPDEVVTIFYDSPEAGNRFRAANQAILEQEVDGARFRAPEEGTWYHPVEPEKLVHIGGDAAEIDEVLTRIDTAGQDRTPPDDPAYQGAGSWLAEWRAAGEKAFQEGRAFETAGDEAAAQRRYRAAVAYFLQASSPHTDDPAQREALERAQESYRALAKLHPLTITEIEIPFKDSSFKAWLHLPDVAGPVPAVVVSMGSDVAKEELLPYFEKQLSIRGVAMLSLDLPGMGTSAEWRASPDLDKLHVAAINHLRTRPEIDGNNLFVQGASFGGHPVARAWLARPDLNLAGAIFMCGPVHSALVAPPKVYAHFPQFTMDGVRTRFGLAPEAGFDKIAAIAETLSLKRQGLFDGPEIATPMFAIATNDDPVIPLEDLDAMLARGSNVKRVIYDTPGHCPERDSREAMAASWVVDQLR